jgi:hypothetical protein
MLVQKNKLAQRAAQNNKNPQQQGLQIQSGQNVIQTLQHPANGNITKTTNNNINNNNNSKFYRLQNQMVDETSLQRMKDLALITFKNLAPDCNDETNKAFDTSINLFLQSLLKEASSSPQPPQIPIAVSRPDPTPVMVQVKQEPKHEPSNNEDKEGAVDEPIDFNDESHTNGNDDASSDEFASVLIPADETKPAPPLVAVLECLAKYFLRHTSTSNKIEDILMDMEEAYWYYIDIYRTVWPELLSVSFDGFTQQMLQNVSFLAAYHFAVINSSDYALVLENFKEYKAQLETCGAILLNPTLEKVLLVTGWHGKSAWMFPAGKKKRTEDQRTCAIRETKEETGYDIASLINAEDCQSAIRSAYSHFIYRAKCPVQFSVQTTDAQRNQKH